MVAHVRDVENDFGPDALEAARLVRESGERVDKLVDEVSTHFKSVARLLSKEPAPDASEEDWSAYFALLDALSNLTIDKHEQARIERRNMFELAYPHMIRDLFGITESSALAAHRFNEISQALDTGITNMAVISFVWSSARLGGAEK